MWFLEFKACLAKIKLVLRANFIAFGDKQSKLWTPKIIQLLKEPERLKDCPLF